MTGNFGARLAALREGLQRLIAEADGEDARILRDGEYVNVGDLQALLREDDEAGERSR